MRDVEYDRFGPWILEINDVDRLPPVFTNYVSKHDDPLLALKIPVPKERRDLSPGEHLYDYLVRLFADRIEILARDEDNAARFSLSYADIVAIKHTEDLLDGHLIIYSPEITYDLPYSTVSVDLIQHVLSIIRERYTDLNNAELPSFADDDGEPSREGLSFLFTGLEGSRRFKGIPGRLFALQTEARMRTVDDRFFRRLFYGAVDKRLLESLHYISEKELEIVTRGRSYAYRWQAIYGKETLYIPLDRLRDIDEESSLRNRGISDLTLSTEASEHVMAFLEDNPAMERYRTIALK